MTSLLLVCVCIAREMRSRVAGRPARRVRAATQRVDPSKVTGAPALACSAAPGGGEVPADPPKSWRGAPAARGDEGRQESAACSQRGSGREISLKCPCSSPQPSPTAPPPAKKPRTGSGAQALQGGSLPTHGLGATARQPSFPPPNPIRCLPAPPRPATARGPGCPGRFRRGGGGAPCAPLSHRGCRPRPLRWRRPHPRRRRRLARTGPRTAAGRPAPPWAPPGSCRASTCRFCSCRAHTSRTSGRIGFASKSRNCRARRLAIHPIG